MQIKETFQSHKKNTTAVDKMSTHDDQNLNLNYYLYLSM